MPSAMQASGREALGTLALAISAAARDGAAPDRRWLLVLDGGAALSVSVEGGWMRWAGDAEQARGATRGAVSCTALLAQQAAWPLALKYSIRPVSGSLSLRCEWPLGDDVEVVRRVVELRDAFAAALGGRGGDPPAAAPATQGAEPGVTPGQLAALCGESGWAATTHPAGVRVPLRTARGAFEPTVESGAAGEVRVSVDLLSDAAREERGLPPLALAAATRLLLGVAGCVRFVRPFVKRASDGALAIGFEVDLGGTPAPFELGSALRALATACALCGPEVVALCTTDLADRLAPWNTGASEVGRVEEAPGAVPELLFERGGL